MQENAFVSPQYFSGKVVLVTGAASGLGKATALAYAACGALVMLSDIRADSGLAVAQEIELSGGKAAFCAADVSVYSEVAALVTRTVEHFGRLDIAVNNAGIGGEAVRTPEVTLEDWDRVIAVNQTGVFYCLKEELKQMEQQGSGAIVNIASIAGLRGMQKQMAYTASKHAVVGITKAVALEYARTAIRINAVCPVFTRTPLLDSLLDLHAGVEARLLQSIPMGRFGETMEVVQAILWLSSAAASFITGLSLPVDGGTMV